MSTFTTDQIAAALVEVLRERLSKREEVRIPGLGTFSVYHEISQMKEGDGGRLEITPPRDVIAFAPDG